MQILSYNFTLGGTYATATLKNATESAKATRTTLDYMAVGLPLGKLELVLIDSLFFCWI
jgi:hypothetical protein